VRARTDAPSYYMHILVKPFARRSRAVRAPFARRRVKTKLFFFLNAFYSSVQMVTTSQLYTCRAGSTLVKEKKIKKKVLKKINIKKKKSFRSWAFTSWFFNGIERANAQNGATRIRARASVGIFLLSIFYAVHSSRTSHWRKKLASCPLAHCARIFAALGTKNSAEPAAHYR
jgi:hypothetical protein